MLDPSTKVVTGEADHPTSGFSLRFKRGAPIGLQPSTVKHHIDSPYHFHLGLKPINSLYLNPGLKAGMDIQRLKNHYPHSYHFDPFCIILKS